METEVKIDDFRKWAFNHNWLFLKKDGENSEFYMSPQSIIYHLNWRDDDGIIYYMSKD
jgi:hypothetical protein